MDQICRNKESSIPNKQFIDHLKHLEKNENMPIQDDTINSSKFELNNRDQERIKDFLSAQYSMP